MRFPSPLAFVVCAALVGGCAGEAKRRAWRSPLPQDAAQPRLREVLAYLAEHGFADAKRAAVFDFSAWPMYDQPSWEDYPRKPRFEAAAFVHEGKSIHVTVLPTKAYHSDKQVSEKVILTYPKDSKEPNGAAVVLEGRRWTVGYKLEQPEAKLSDQLTQLLRDFVRDYARRLTQQPAP